VKGVKAYLRLLEDLAERDHRYRLEAYNFVMAALNHTVDKLKKPRHVSGGELLGGIKEYAMLQFGPMAKSVLDHWGITKTEDFGHIVFNLVDAGLLRKTEEDSIEDFKNGYDFSHAFESEYTYQIED